MSEQSPKPESKSLKDFAKIAGTAAVAGLIAVAAMLPKGESNQPSESPKVPSTNVEVQDQQAEINLPAPEKTVVSSLELEDSDTTTEVTAPLNSVDTKEEPEVIRNDNGTVIPQIGTVTSIVAEQGSAAVQELQQPTLNSVVYEDVAAPEQLALPVTDEVAVAAASTPEVVAVGEAPIPSMQTAVEASSTSLSAG